jgi:hypothetical protein
MTTRLIFIEEKYLEKSSADGDLISKPNRV